MRAGNDRARAERHFPDDGKHERLAAVIPVYLHAGRKRHAGHVLDKALLPRQRDGVADGLALHPG